MDNKKMTTTTDAITVELDKLSESFDRVFEVAEEEIKKYVSNHETTVTKEVNSIKNRLEDFFLEYFPSKKLAELEQEIINNDEWTKVVKSTLEQKLKFDIISQVINKLFAEIDVEKIKAVLKEIALNYNPTEDMRTINKNIYDYYLSLLTSGLSETETRIIDYIRSITSSGKIAEVTVKPISEKPEKASSQKFQA